MLQKVTDTKNLRGAHLGLFGLSIVFGRRGSANASASSDSCLLHGM